MHAAERAHNYVDFYLQTTSTVSEVYDVDHRYDICRPVPYAGHYADETSNSRRSPSLRSISVDENHPYWRSPTYFFVPSHWLERSSCWFAVTLLVFSRADHSKPTSPVLTISHVVLSQLLLKACFKKPPYSSDPFWLVPLPWCHTPRLIYVVFISLLKTFEYAAKQARKQLQCNKAKLPQPFSINGLHIHRALGYASRNNYAH